MRRTSLAFFTLFALIATLLLGGCSVKMAASTKNTPNLSVIAVGQDRYFVVSQIGNPNQSSIIDDERVDNFIINKNNVYLGYTRAFIYGLLDMGTLGLWELIGTPLEEFIQSEDKMTIYYDSEDKVQLIHHIKNVK